ncbi:hemin uptake protein HemP [Methylotenera sp.]|uniref:hemin uptake protein HemP n=2 Tax=Methylotenera sp. TaxID=2051956 RepID=UPI00272B3F9B|nr:hemin uptake protein HemP [Methylotenera sp.]
MIIVIICIMSKDNQDNFKVSNIAKNLQKLHEAESAVLKTRIANIRATTSEVLLAGARELVIKHAGEDYYLRLTSQGKLILTK